MKTAVEWLVDRYNANAGYLTYSDIKFAKEMEKKQIVDTYVVGYGKGITHGAINPEQYYNETFKQEQ
jgi:hypothetical protein